MTPDKFAKWTLGIEASFCLVGGLVLMLGGVFMADAVGVSGWIISGLGVGVNLWTLLVAFAGSRQHVVRSEFERVIRGNLTWVVLSVVVLGVPGTMSGGGKVALAIVAALVLGLALVQLRARHNLIRVGFGAPDADAEAESSA